MFHFSTAPGMFRIFILTAVAGLFLSAAPASAQIKAQDQNPVVATVNGSAIFQSDLEEAKQMLPAQYQQAPANVLFEMLVSNIIDTRLAAQEARKEKLDQTDAYKKQMAQLANRVLQRDLVSKHLDGRINEQVLQSRYQKFVKDFPKTEEVRARHILLKTDAEAKEVIAALEKGGDFAELAKKRSTGPSGANGGDLGFFSKEKMVPAFSEAAFKLAKKEFSKSPVKTQFGWHVILVEDKRTQGPPALEAVQQQLAQEMTQEIITDYFSGLRKNADIKLFNMDGTPMPTAPK